MESKTIRQLQDYCRENNIRGYSKLKKSELIELIQSRQQQRASESRLNVFQFHDDVFRPNATKVFYDMLRREAPRDKKKIYDHVYPIKMTAEDEAHFKGLINVIYASGTSSKYPSPYSSKNM
ncbi:hypothetical protein TNCV_1078841 [Trichonephila clavipes]|nr:hypothetical protein TNCV_1078841 [Trichonephila clavipes]